MSFLTVAVVITGVSPASAEMVVSTDGHHLYVGDSGHRVFASDPATGTLTEIQSSFRETGHYGLGGEVAGAPDGRNVYFGEDSVWVGGFKNSAYGSLHVMSRDGATGQVTHEASVFGGPYPGSWHIGRISDLVLSPDGRHLYVAERQPTALRVFERSPSDGIITQIQVLYVEDGLPITDLGALALSPDGRELLLGGVGIAAMTRDLATGGLSAARQLERSGGTFWDVDYSPDGSRVYASSDPFTAFARDPSNGELTRLPKQLDPLCDSCDNQFVAVSPDGKHVFSTRNGPFRLGAQPLPPVLVQARVTADGVELEREYRDDRWGLHDPRDLAWSPDGRMSYVESEGGIAARRYIDGALEPPAYPEPVAWVESERYWQPSMTINDGARYTNDPNVTVLIRPPRGVYALRLANRADELTRSASIAIGPGKVRTYQWRLDTTEPGRSSKRVHVRFNPTGPDVIELFDDIVLDQTPPTLIAAHRSGSRVRIRARDNRSGVERAQLTTNRKKPGRLRKFKTSLPAPSASKPVFARVIDRAGNSSKWRRASP